MGTVSTPRGLTYTPPHAAITWSELHADLVPLADHELSLEAVDSILRLTAASYVYSVWRTRTSSVRC